MQSITFYKVNAFTFDKTLASFFSSIDEETTPEHFESLKKNYPGFTFKHVGRYSNNMLELAIKYSNLPLFNHICDQPDGQTLINRITNNFRTPLLHATLCKDQTKSYLMAVRLLKLKANINAATSAEAVVSARPFMGYRPSNDRQVDYATPLWVAAERTDNQKLIRLFLDNGAIAYPSLSEEGFRKIIQAVNLNLSPLLCAAAESDWLLEMRIPRGIVEKIVSIVPSLFLAVPFAAREI